MAASPQLIWIKPLHRSMGLAVAMGLLVTGCIPSTDSSSTPPQEVETPASSSPDRPSALEVDTVVVPGDRVGLVTTTTTYEDLVDLYGEAALEDVNVHQGEGLFLPGTRVNQGDRSFSVVWSDETRTAIQTVQDFGSAWQVDPGIGVGTSFADLQSKLGTFELYGFGWDYGGTLRLDSTDLAPHTDVLVLRVSPTVDPTTVRSSYETVMGDQLYPSTTPTLQDLDLAVSDMIVTLE
jgi:hypothetical protein